ncbi:hypothetical protein ACFL3G_10970 [Planctomycetota bacterium]
MVKPINILVILILIVMSLAIFANSMTKPLGHDEQMYCAGAAMLSQGKMIYRDFSYIAQLPWHPLICAGLYKIFNTTNYLLTTRLFSVLCNITTLICIVAIYRRLFTDTPKAGALLAIAAGTLYIFNPIVAYANGHAWNHDFIVAAVAVSFWLFVTTDFKHRSRYYRIAAIAALLTIATWMRITTALIQLLFFVFILINSPGQRLKNALTFIVTTAVLSIWPVWTFSLAPQAFAINLFHIPTLNAQYLHEIGMAYNKLDLTISILKQPANLVLIGLTGYFYIAATWQKAKQKHTNSIFAVLLTIAFCVIAFLPPTMWIQYLAPPVPLLLICLAYPLSRLNKLNTKNHYPAALIIFAILTVYISPYLKNIPAVFKPQRWVPIQLHKTAIDIAANTKEPKRILTLAPLFALEGNCTIYPQLSAGPFVYRVADNLSKEQQKITTTTGTKSIRKLLQDQPPSAVIVGTEPLALEAPLLETTVISNPENWRKKQYPNGLIVYFRR